MSRFHSSRNPADFASLEGICVSDRLRGQRNAGGGTGGGHSPGEEPPPEPTTTLAISIGDTNQPAPGGFQFTYTIEVENTGDVLADNVEVLVTLDPELTYVTASGTGWTFDEDAGVVTATRPALGARVTRTFTITASTSAGEVTVTTEAEIAADNADPLGGEATTMADTDSLESEIVSTAAISHVEYDYEIDVENTGDIDAENVTTTIALGDGISYVSATGTGWTIDEDAGTVTATRAALAPGAAPTITITVLTADAANTASTIATADADNAAASVDDTATTVINLVDRDAQADKRIPSSLQQLTDLFNYFGIDLQYLPKHGYLFNESSGVFVDFIATGGAKNLTVSSTPTRNKPVDGWDKTSVGASADATNQFANNGSMGNVATTDLFTLAYMKIAQSTSAHQRLFHGVASGNALEAIANSPNVRYRVGGQAQNGSVSHVGDVFVVGLIHSITASLNVLLTNLEKRTNTFATTTGTELRATFKLGAAGDSNSEFLYLLDFEVNMPEAVGKTIFQAFNWTVTAF